jgi:hypothetical protein
LRALLLAFPRGDTNHRPWLKLHVISPKHACRVRKHFVSRKEPPRTKRHTPSERTHHLRVGWLPFRKNRLDKSFGIEFLCVLAKVFFQVVLDCGWAHDIVSRFQGVAANGSFLRYEPVGRRGGMQSESFVIVSPEERAGGEKILYLLQRNDGVEGIGRITYAWDEKINYFSCFTCSERYSQRKRNRNKQRHLSSSCL